jgi:hypothetical protein
MAIEKKLIHFNKNEDFQSRLNNNEILDTSIIFIKDINAIYTHDTEYQYIGWSYIGTPGSPEPPIEIPKDYTYVQPMYDDWWIDAENKVILVKDGYVIQE